MSEKQIEPSSDAVRRRLLIEQALDAVAWPYDIGGRPQTVADVFDAAECEGLLGLKWEQVRALLAENVIDLCAQETDRLRADIAELERLWKSSRDTCRLVRAQQKCDHKRAEQLARELDRVRTGLRGLAYCNKPRSAETFWRSVQQTARGLLRRELEGGL